ncbi:MAG: MmcQ/YjbR family DNA-binding protein [Bacilli bacterium]|nr:MmcQ/YjbR family DNA-binding protein [Bacilli bacterium]
MHDESARFLHKKPDLNLLIKYGFVKEDDIYKYGTTLRNGEFRLEVIYDKKQERFFSEVYETSFNDVYPLIYMDVAHGEYVGELREEYQGILEEIARKTCMEFVFKNDSTNDLIAYVKEKYGVEMDFPWTTPGAKDYAVLRREDNQKWFGLLSTIKGKSLGLNEGLIIEALNVRYSKDETDKIWDNVHIFPAYHMNKKSWITLILDNSCPLEQYKTLIDQSYELALGKKGGKK